MPGEGEAERFALSPMEFTPRVVTGMSIAFKDAAGAVSEVVAQMGPRTMRG